MPTAFIRATSSTGRQPRPGQDEQEEQHHHDQAGGETYDQSQHF